MKKPEISAKNKPVSRIILVSVFVFVLTIGLSADGQKDKVDPALISTFKKANKFYKKGLTSFSKNKLDKAAENLNKCLGKFPNHAGAYFYLAKIAYQRGNLEEANTNVVKAKEYYPTFVKMNQAVFRNMAKDFSDSRAEISSRSKMKGSFSSSGNRRAAREGGIHMDRAAEGHQKYMQSIKSVQADYHFLHGNIYYKTKKLNEAVTEFVQTLKLNPRHNLVYTNLASIYFMAKDYEKAKALLKQAEANGVAVNPKLKAAIENK